MKPEDIEQMKRDREAGTPGPWRIGSHDPLRGIWVGGSDENGSAILPYLWFGHTINFPDHYEANARRIARVPDLEAEVLRLREALAEARTDLMISADNARDATKTDPRWDGVAGKLMARVRDCDKALNGYAP